MECHTLTVARIEDRQTAEKWLGFLHFKHILPNARHCCREKQLPPQPWHLTLRFCRTFEGFEK